MLYLPVGQELKKWEGSYPKGWRTIVEKGITQCSKVKSLIQIDQIKDKFGRLRFYYTVVSQEQEFEEVLELGEPLRTYIYSLEETCAHICEECGTTLDVNTSSLNPPDFGWVYTLCPACREYKRKERGIK